MMISAYIKVVYWMVAMGDDKCIYKGSLLGGCYG